jgi:hypothetical protein
MPPNGSAARYYDCSPPAVLCCMQVAWLLGCIANTIYFFVLAVSLIPTQTVIVDDRKHHLSDLFQTPDSLQRPHRNS